MRFLSKSYLNAVSMRFSLHSKGVTGFAFADIKEVDNRTPSN